MKDPLATSQGRKVGVFRHLGCLFYDLFIVLTILFIGTGLALLTRHGKAFEPHHIYYSFYLLCLWAGYFVLSWSVGGQTIGMRAWKVQLVDNQTLKPVTPLRACLRFGYAIPSLLLAGIGIWWKWIDKNTLCWHDHWSKTHLIYIARQ